MEWINELQQVLGRPVLAFAREYWMFLLVGLTVIAAGLFRGSHEGSDVTEMESGEGDGD